MVKWHVMWPKIENRGNWQIGGKFTLFRWIVIDFSHRSGWIHLTFYVWNECTWSSKFKFLNNSRLNEGIENDVFPHNFLLKSNGQLFQMRNVRDINFNMNEKNVITQFLFFNPSKIILVNYIRLYRVVTKISSCRVNTTSRRGINASG